MNTNTLTKQELRALRHADLIAVQFYHDEYCLRAIKEAHFNEEVTIRVGGHIRAYGSHNQAVSAFSLVYTYCEEIKTVLDSLREGDRLELEFVADNSSGYMEMEEAGLTMDIARLIVYRGEATERRATFTLESSITPPDSSARMVRF